jgi:hypothetical protein
MAGPLPLARATHAALARAGLARRVAHALGEAFPAERRAMGEPALHALVALAAERARAHGFETDLEFERYATVALFCGAGFDRDPQLPWAAEALAGDGAGPAQRSMDLHERALLHLEAVAGPANEHLFAALRAVRAGAWRAPRPAEQSVDEHFAEILFDLYPEKARRIDRGARAALLARASEAAAELGLEGEALLTSLGVAMFLMGTGLLRDPQFAWASRALSRGDGEAAPSGQERLARFHEAAREHAGLLLDLARRRGGA